MLFKKTLGFIGSGNITSHLVKGFLQFQKLSSKQIWVSNRSSQKAELLGQSFGVSVAKNNEELVDRVDIIFLAVKPQDLAELCEELNRSITPYQHVVSLAAGVTLDSLQKRLGTAKVSRYVPNIAVSLGRGVIGCFSNARYLVEELAQISSELGYFLNVKEENQLDALLVATSSGLGFTLELMSYVIDWLESYGFSSSEARSMVENTFLASGLISQQNPQRSIESLVDQVASRKGVTERGLQTLRSFEMDRLIRMTLDGAKSRSEELARHL